MDFYCSLTCRSNLKLQYFWSNRLRAAALHPHRTASCSLPLRSCTSRGGTTRREAVSRSVPALNPTPRSREVNADGPCHPNQCFINGRSAFYKESRNVEYGPWNRECTINANRAPNINFKQVKNIIKPESFISQVSECRVSYYFANGHGCCPGKENHP